MTSKLDDILTDLSTTVFCKGQDWKTGDGSASEVDGITDTARKQIKQLMLEILNDRADSIYCDRHVEIDSDAESMLETITKEIRIRKSLIKKLEKYKNIYVTTSNSLTVYNVKNYGAVGDGVTDDTMAFQDTINAVNAVTSDIGNLRDKADAARKALQSDGRSE